MALNTRHAIIWASDGTESLWLMSVSTGINVMLVYARWANGGGCRGRDDVIKWKHFPRHWPFVRGIHRSTVNSPHKGQWRGALMFSLICVWINGWVNNREAGDLRRNRSHYDVIIMSHPPHIAHRVTAMGELMIPRHILARGSHGSFSFATATCEFFTFQLKYESFCDDYTNDFLVFSIPSTLH